MKILFVIENKTKLILIKSIHTLIGVFFNGVIFIYCMPQSPISSIYGSGSGMDLYF